MLGTYITVLCTWKAQEKGLFGHAGQFKSEEMGRTEPQPLAILGKDTGHQVKGQSPSSPTTPLGQVRSHGPQFPHP